MAGSYRDGCKMASRVREIMGHTTRYCFDGRMRMMADTGISRSEMTRLLSGDCNPSHRVVMLVVEALERQLCRRLDCRDALSFSGEFPTGSVCQLVSCQGCPQCRPFEKLSLFPERRPSRQGPLPDVASLAMPEYEPLTNPKEDHE